MWNDVDETTAAPFLQCDCQKVRAVFKLPSLRYRVELYPWCQMDFGNGHRGRGESAAASEAGMALPNRETILPDGAVDGTSSQMPAQVFWQLFCIWLWSRLNVKFRNQLHFKSYMHIRGHDEILLWGAWYDSCWCGFECILPAVICQGRSKFRTVCLFFKNPLPQDIAKPLDVKYYLKKQNGMAPSVHLILNVWQPFCSETISASRRVWSHRTISLHSSEHIAVF